MYLGLPAESPKAARSFSLEVWFFRRSHAQLAMLAPPERSIAIA
jgi:hypothetical protein